VRWEGHDRGDRKQPWFARTTAGAGLRSDTADADAAQIRGGKYEAVGRWLGGEGSPLEGLAIAIYPQGSMAMGLTVRPYGRLEHDLDLIFEIERININPLQLHDIVDARLRENELYAARLVTPAPARCLRLSYAGDFHLDIVPSRKNPTLGKTAIEVPDRELKCWMPNDPLGYQALFEQRCVTLAIMEKAEPRPVPGLVPSEQKPPLKRAVQLIKRHRDVIYATAPGTPGSILLTTMAATFYNGEVSVVHALVGVLVRIENALRAAWPMRIWVPNPTNSREDLCAKFSDEQYARFVQWLTGFNDQVRKLIDARGLDQIASILKILFGEKVTISVVKSYMQKLDEARKARQLRYTSGGLSVGSGIVAPSHVFHGDK
jgi:hypothetical protein